MATPQGHMDDLVPGMEDTVAATADTLDTDMDVRYIGSCMIARII